MQKQENKMNKEDRQRAMEAFGALLDIMEELREKCPWDRKQTLQTLRPLTIEETYELSDAILQNQWPELKKECGDLLLHLVFYAKIGAENNRFDMGDVIQSLNEKLIYRHPHIYGDASAATEEEVKQNWEKLKIKEGNTSVLSGVTRGAPSLIKAARVQEKVRGIGFDFATAEDSWQKVEEELSEFKNADNTQDKEMEFGDVLFSLVNYARLQQIDADTALAKSTDKFIARFKKMEDLARESQEDITGLSTEQLESYWQLAKEKLM